jgi:hypothetical protein
MTMVDLAVVDLKWRIGLAKNGDSGPLAELLLRSKDPIPYMLRKFLAGVITHKIKLKRPKKLTDEWKSRRFWKERNVAWAVDDEMRSRGKQRDEALRTYLTRTWSEYYRTTPNAVASYRKHHSSPRRATDLLYRPRHPI